MTATQLCPSAPSGPELLVPAGDLSKLYTAVTYGADAVYIGGPLGGLRQRAGNFTLPQIEQAVTYTRRHEVNLYVTLNIFPTAQDMDLLLTYMEALKRGGVRAVIVSDPVVCSYARQMGFAVHISTQASCLNHHEAQMWKEMGASRIVVGRELSIEQGAALQEAAGVEVEMFVHGSLCLSYSGKCLISNYVAGRDANRGGCVQSCRWPFVIDQKKSTFTVLHPLNSLDLMGLPLVPRFVQQGIRALKVEGRMKSHLYIAAATSAYRQALDCYLAGQELDTARLQQLVSMVSNRGFSSGFLNGHPPGEGLSLYGSGYQSQVDFLGHVLEQDDDGNAWIHFRAPYDHQRQQLYLLGVDGSEQAINRCLYAPDGTVRERIVSNGVAIAQLPAGSHHLVLYGRQRGANA
ncbi:peptidase U32 family protein [Desulfurispira natronophila]|uniref:Putative protease n=1 Tax=Desulfurispira natronophila TaxID=682562 RepID=A0A7W7Y4R0_9BACT|nr:peptidase U32 family protein [Desulfurispira natronophila]MBB5022055.1 putative protease [Desulfurispira natronophila]